MADNDLRARIDAVIRPTMLIGLQDAELDGPGGTQRINEWADWISGRVSELVQPDLDRLTTERDAARSGREQLRAISRDHRSGRDRYRLAWKSARQRAQAYGEGILRHVEERDTYAGWEKAQARRAHAAEVERDGLQKLLAKTTAVADRQAAELAQHAACARCGHERYQHERDPVLRAMWCRTCTTLDDLHDFTPATEETRHDA